MVKRLKLTGDEKDETSSAPAGDPFFERVPDAFVEATLKELPAVEGVMAWADIPPSSRAVLERFGLSKLNELPGNLASMALFLKERMAKAKLHVEDASSPEPPLFVLSLWSEAQRQKLAAALQAAVERYKTLRADEGDLSPFLEEEEEEEETPREEDLEAQRRATVQRLLGQEDETPPSNAGASGAGGNRTATTPATCPHCGHDVAKGLEVEASDQDKIAYLASLLGEQSFQKIYSLFGGALVISLRETSSQDADLIAKRLRYERQKGLLDDGQMAIMSQYFCYQLVFSLLRVDGRDPDAGLDIAGSVDAAKSRYLVEGLWKGEESVAFLAEAHAKLQGEVFRTEGAYKAAIGALHEFNRLLAYFVARRDDANFWPATARSTS